MGGRLFFLFELLFIIILVAHTSVTIDIDELYITISVG